MTRGKAAWLALLCSFSVYFIPTVVGPHGIHLVLDDIWQQFRDFKNPAWAFRSLGMAVGLQAAAFAPLYWFWHWRTLLSFVALFVCSVAAIVLVQFVYMLWLPSTFLIESETAAETGTWAEACRVADASVLTLRTPRRLPAGGWSEAWLGDSQNRKWLLRMPDCQRVAATIPQPHMEPGGRVDFLIGIAQVVPGGLALVQCQDISNPSKPVWYLVDTATGTLNALRAPGITEIVGPYLSDDGLRTAWIVPITGSGPPRLDTLRVLPLEPAAREQLLDLSPFGPIATKRSGSTLCPAPRCSGSIARSRAGCWPSGWMARSGSRRSSRLASDRSRTPSC
jgi:hypothetical protein